MKNTFGTSVSLTVFGESHGSEIGVVLDGLAPGIDVDAAEIAAALTLRRPVGAISTPRREEDPFRIVSGVKEGKTTGTPIAILIPNGNTKSGDYAALSGKARPGHADYAAECKYHGYQDERGGGHFSGRITAGVVAAGAICRAALKQKGILIGTHIKRLHGIEDRAFGDLKADATALERRPFAVLNEEIGQRMQEEILRAAAEGDSVGGVLESVVLGMPAGVGEPWFDTVESVLSHLLFAIPGIKGVMFGDGFALSEMKGSEANDPFAMENGSIVTLRNRNGGINGGITNGMPICFSCAVKPTPTIAKEQQTVDFRQKKDTVIAGKGRHDPAIVHRVRAVVDAVTALALCDMLGGRFGTDWLMT